MENNLDFRTSYNQFYICDKASPRDTDTEDFWTTDAYNDRLALEEGILGVGTECYGHVKCELHILNTVNQDIKYDLYDHIVEGSLVVKSGILQVLDCPNSEVELEIQLKPGTYRVRVFSSNLAGTDIDEDEGNDYYRIEIWPDIKMERKVLKRYIQPIS